jgi:heptosyltransferase-2/heptosyltransferase-3
LLLLIILAWVARPFVRRPGSPVRTILYIKPDHLGDLLLATPVITQLRHSFLQARIVGLVGPWSRFILEQNPDLDTVLTCPFPGFERTPPPATGLIRWLRPYLTLFQYAWLLRQMSIDLALIGRDDHWWGAALALLAGIPQRVGFAVPECRPFLSHALPWDASAHVTHQGLALVAAVSTTRQATTLPPTRFTPSASDQQWASDWLHTNCGISRQRLVIIHPGTGGPTKLWLAARWAALADQLVAEDNCQIVLTGGPGEEALVAEVRQHMHQPALALAGTASIGQLAALLQRATLVIGVDSGPLHLAIAVGSATLHLFGPSDQRRFGPWGPPEQHIIIRSGVACSPCGVFAACPRGLAQPECMERIALGEVVAAVRQSLNTA